MDQSSCHDRGTAGQFISLLTDFCLPQAFGSTFADAE
jgi:hypothetical protein